jgi:hypothetical protein
MNTPSHSLSFSSDAQSKNWLTKKAFPALMKTLPVANKILPVAATFIPVLRPVAAIVGTVSSLRR